MTCLGPYEMFYFFLTLCFIDTKFCVLACLIIWMHTNNFYLSLQVALWNVFFPLRNSVLCI